MPKNVWGVLLKVLPTVDTSVFTVNVARVSPEFRNAFVPMLVTDDGIVMDVKKVTSWKAFASILLKPVIVRLRTYDNPLSFTIVLVNCPVPLKTLYDKYILILDLLYNVLSGPDVIPRPSKMVDSSNVAVVIPEPWNALPPILVTEDGIVMDVRAVAFRKALAPMLVYVAIRTLVAPYNNAVAPDNDPLPLNTLVIHDTVIPDFPYSGPGTMPGIIARPSKMVDSSNVAVVIPDLSNAFKPMNVTDDGMVMDVKVLTNWNADSSIIVTELGIVIDVNLVS